MKKKQLLILSAALVMVCAGAVLSRTYSHIDDLFNMSLESLTDGEGIKGYCYEQEGDCLWVCPKCHSMYEATGMHQGPGHDEYGTCVVCHTTVE